MQYGGERTAIEVALMIADFRLADDPDAIGEKFEHRLGGIGRHGQHQPSLGLQHAFDLVEDRVRMGEMFQHGQHRHDVKRRVGAWQPVDERQLPGLQFCRGDQRRLEIEALAARDVWLDRLEKGGVHAASDVQQHAVAMLPDHRQHLPDTHPSQ